MPRIAVLSTNVRIALWLACMLAAAPAQGATMRELFRAGMLAAPQKEEIQPATPITADDKGKFTGFGPTIDAPHVTPHNTLQFRLKAVQGDIAWGNYEGREPVSARTSLWAGPMTVRIEARQHEAAESTWDLVPWCDGLRGGKFNAGKETRGEMRRGARPPGVKARLTGSDWQTLEFKIHSLRSPDGFEIRIAGRAGQSVEIRGVTFHRSYYEGYFRKEFDLPSGEIWRAVADVGNQAVLYINGRLVPSVNPLVLRPVTAFQVYYATEAMDLTPYLRPGRNCIALCGRRGDSWPYVFLQGAVVMRSGKRVALDSDGSWRSSPSGPAGWNEVGFDDRAWKAAESRPGAALYYKEATARPAYEGRIVLENPGENQLFFVDRKPVDVAVRIPAGLADQKPRLAWSIDRVRKEPFTTAAQGVESQFTPAGGSLLTHIRPGQLPRGVYLLRASLEGTAGRIEERTPEPLVVVGRLDMKEVDGERLEADLQPKLEDAIDMTDPADRHPSLETDGKTPVARPTIVTSDGLKYRQTAPQHEALISYQVSFQHPGDFYLMELDYPDNATRWIGVSITSGMQDENSKDGPAVFTGQKYPLSGRMRTLRWIHRADPGPQALNVSNISRDTPAAGAGIRIFHVGPQLPALAIHDAGQRLLGVYTERTAPLGGYGKTFGFAEDPVPTGHLSDPRADPVLAACKQLQRLLDSAEAYTQYLRFTGQNFHVMGCLQYMETNTSYTPLPGTAECRVLVDPRDVAARVFRENGIRFATNLEWVCNTTLLGEYPQNDTAVARGADTLYMVDGDGHTPWAWAGRYGFNYLHPRVDSLMLGAAEHLAGKYKHLPNYVGIYWTNYLGGDMLPAYACQPAKDPLHLSYDDVTIAAFQKKTGITVPGIASDPRRFAARKAFLTDPKRKDQWLAWRCEALRAWFGRLHERIRAVRPDLQCIVSLYVDQFHAMAWKQGTLALDEFCRQAGWDLKRFGDEPGLSLPRYLHATLRYTSLNPGYYTHWPAGWELNTGPEYRALTAGQAERSVFVMHHWQEHERVAQTLPEKPGWPRPFQMTYQAQAAGDNARECFTQALVLDDPRTVVFGFCDLVMLTGHERPLQEFARVYRALPAVNFEPFDHTGLETNLVVRHARTDDGYYLLVANPGWWPIRGQVRLAGTQTINDLATGRDVALAGDNLAIDLKPYGLAAFKASGTQPKLTSWSNQPVAPEELKHLAAVIQRGAEPISGMLRATPITTDDRRHVVETSAAAAKELAAGHYAKAGGAVSDWRYWLLVHLPANPQRPTAAAEKRAAASH